MFQEAQARASRAIADALIFDKKKSRAAKEPKFLLKDHKFKIRTSAVTEIKDFEQQQEPCCFAIKTK